MVKTTDEILTAINAVIGNDTSDSSIQLLEDVADTLNEYNNNDWKQKYEENDKMWREKYKQRFMQNVVQDEVIDGDNPDNYDNNVDSEEDVKKTFADLFKKEEN